MARYQGGGGASAIKSIQTGYVSVPLANTDSVESMPYADVTIAPVDPSKSIVDWTTLTQIRHMYITAANQAQAQNISARILNPTTIRFTSRMATASTGQNLEGRWRVVEYI